MVMEITVKNNIQLIAMQQNEKWDIVIESGSRKASYNFSEIWRYRDLLFLFVKRDIVAIYKQTVLGPIWFFVQPVMSALVFTVIFSVFAKVRTDGAPPVLFYLGGLTLWNYFAECLLKTSETFIQNQHIFGKVYFPRLIVPLSFTISNLFKLGIQMLVFLVVWTYHFYLGEVHIKWTVLLLPVLVLITSGLSLGLGVLFSAVTTKYRDIRFLLQFGIQLMMYVSSVIIPLSQVPVRYQWLMKLNPMVAVVEIFKFSFLGTGVFDPYNLLYSFGVMLLLLLVGFNMFSKVEKNFMDVI
jgi:lipopolysaccharide transport system permease protein